MKFHTFTVSIVYFFVIIIIHVLIKNNSNNYFNQKSDDTDYETDYYSDNELVFDLNTIDNLKKETLERTNHKPSENTNNLENNSDDIRSELLKYLDLEEKESMDLKTEYINKRDDILASNSNNTEKNSDFTNEKTDLSSYFTKNKIDDSQLNNNIMAYDDLDTNYALFS